MSFSVVWATSDPLLPLSSIILNDQSVFLISSEPLLSTIEQSPKCNILKVSKAHKLMLFNSHINKSCNNQSVIASQLHYSVCMQMKNTALETYNKILDSGSTYL